MAHWEAVEQSATLPPTPHPELEQELARRRSETAALTARLAEIRTKLESTRAQGMRLRTRRARTGGPSEGPLILARRAAEAMDHHRAALGRLADERAAAVRAALGLGMSRSDVARALGISPQAITKLLKSRDAP